MAKRKRIKATKMWAMLGPDGVPLETRYLKIHDDDAHVIILGYRDYLALKRAAKVKR